MEIRVEFDTSGLTRPPMLLHSAKRRYILGGSHVPNITATGPDAVPDIPVQTRRTGGEPSRSRTRTGNPLHSVTR